jgi:hypothetical protein
VLVLQFLFVPWVNFEKACHNGFTSQLRFTPSVVGCNFFHQADYTKWNACLGILNKLTLMLTLYSTHTRFYACASSVDPDQLAHLCHLIWICTGHILIRNNLIIYTVRHRVDPDQIAQMSRLIWIYTVRPRNKGVSVEERVNKGRLYNLEGKRHKHFYEYFITFIPYPSSH